MKKNVSIDWLSILLISTFSLNTIINIFLYIEEQNAFGLFRLILYPFCLVFYILVLIISKVYGNKKYLIIYNDFFEIYDKSIFDSKLVRECKNKKYIRYGLAYTHEKRYEFSYNELILDFGLIKIDDNKKLMIIYKIKNLQDDFYEALFVAFKKAREHYYDNNEICHIEGNDVFYKNKRNAFQIKEVNGKFNIIRYRHYIPIEIHRIKFLANYKVDWEYIGSTHEDGMRYFETYDEARDYIISLNMYQ